MGGAVVAAHRAEISRGLAGNLPRCPPPRRSAPRRAATGRFVPAGRRY